MLYYKVIRPIHDNAQQFVGFLSWESNEVNAVIERFISTINQTKAELKHFYQKIVEIILKLILKKETKPRLFSNAFKEITQSYFS